MKDDYIRNLRAVFEENADYEKAIRMKAYMRDQYEFFGIMAQKQREIRKDFIKTHGLPSTEELPELIRALWDQPEREFQHFGMELLEMYRKELKPEVVHVFEFTVITRSWWDTVDYIAAWLIGTHFRRFPEMIPEYTEKWMNSGNLWLQRSALLFQLKYKSKTDTTLLFNLINRLSGEKDFFIRKAIGWVLREYSKTDPTTVIQFVENNHLSALSKKEALKVINRTTIKQKKSQFL